MKIVPSKTNKTAKIEFSRQDLKDISQFLPKVSWSWADGKHKRAFKIGTELRALLAKSS